MWPRWWGAGQSWPARGCPMGAGPGALTAPLRCLSSRLLAGLGAVFHVLNPAEPIWYKFMLIPRPPPFAGLFREPEKAPL